MNINITLTWTPRPGQSNHILEVSVHLHSLQMEDRWFTQENKLGWFNPSHLLRWHSKRMEEKNKGRWQKKKAELCLHVREQGFSQNHGIMVITSIPSSSSSVSISGLVLGIIFPLSHSVFY